MDRQTELYEASFSPLYEKIRAEYAIDRSYFRSENIKLGLRNLDGTGVIVGVTKIVFPSAGRERLKIRYTGTSTAAPMRQRTPLKLSGPA